MNTDYRKSYFINIACIIALSFVYCITGGLVQYAAGILTSALIGVSATKHHYLFVFSECAAAVLVITLYHSFIGGIIGTVAGVTAGVILVLLGVGLGLSTNLKMSISGTVLVSSAIYLANMLIGFGVLGREIPFEMLLAEFKNILTETINMQYAGMPEITSQADVIIDSLMETAFKFMPSMLICSAVISGLVLTYVYKAILNRNNKNLKTESFSFLRAERSIGLIFIFALAALAVTENALLSDALLNLVVIMCFVFFVCGLSYIDFSMKSKGKNKTYRTLMIIVVIPLMTMFFALPAVLIAGTGFFDTLINFRKRKEIKEDENGAE